MTNTVKPTDDQRCKPTCKCVDCKCGPNCRCAGEAVLTSL